MITQTEHQVALSLNYKNLFDFINSKFGKCYSNEDYYRHIDLWLRLYQGYVKEAHEIVTNNGISSTTRKASRLDMASQVAQDWMKCLIADKPIITVAGKNQSTSRFVQGAKGNGGVLNSNNFYKLFTDAVERSFALGTSALVLGVEKDGVNESYKIDINSYNANAIIPIEYKAGEITECAFLSEFYRDGNKMYNLSCHVKDEAGKYLIYNFESKGDLKFDMYLNKTVEPLVTASEKPFFFILSPVCANKIDLNSPLGMSCYAEATDIVLNCDYFYDALKMDVLTGQRIILMHKSLMGRDDSGNLIPPQDVKKYFMAYTGDEMMMDDNGNPSAIKDFTPKLNTAELCDTIQQNLNLLSMRCGLGNQFYHFDKVTGVTATEVVSSNMDLIRSVKVNSEALVNIMTDLIKQIIWIGRNTLGYTDLAEDAKVSVLIPDGVVTDDHAEKEQDRQDVAAGIMSKAEFRAKWYGETLEDAQKKIDEMNQTNKEVNNETKDTSTDESNPVQNKQETEDSVRQSGDEGIQSENN